jgi:hypothetical protein
MELFPNINQIEFLMERRFGRLPNHPDGRVVVTSAEAGVLSLQTYPNTQDARKAYWAALMEMDAEKREALYRDELKKQQEEERAEADLAEAKRLFNQPDAKADFNHWSKAAFWSLDEATALSFGREPRVVKWETVKECAKASPFAREYEKLRDLILRSHEVAHLDDPVLPGFYVAWARRNDIEFPADLEAAVAARGVQIGDWKSKYDELSSRYDDLLALSEKAGEQVKTEWDINQRLRQQIVELEAALNAAPKPHKGLHGKERESVLKLIIGMAVGGYGYDPRRGRSDVVAIITSDLAKAGIALDPDTVRKWIKQAAELLPPSEDQ